MIIAERITLWLRHRKVDRIHFRRDTLRVLIPHREVFANLHQDECLSDRFDRVFALYVQPEDGPWRGVEDVELATLAWVAWWLRGLDWSADDLDQGPIACSRDVH